MLGWVRLILATIAEVYLVMMLTLVAIAFLPALLGWQSTVIQTGSMGPHISPGDVVVASSFSPHMPVPIGGVVTFTGTAPDGSERSVLHRVIDANDDGTFVTAGDANADPDSSPLHRDQITGLARLLVPFIGLPSLWLATGNIGALLLWAALTAIALIAVYTAYHNDSSENEDDEESQPTDETSPGITRGTVLSGLGLAGVGLLLLRSVPESSAAFTASTSAAGNKWAFPGIAAPSLGRAASYRLLASQAISNTRALLYWTTQVEGSIATSPSTTIENMNNGFFLRNVTGDIHRNTSASRGAMDDARTLSSNLLQHPSTATAPTTLQGRVLPGTYSRSGTITVRGTVTLDGQGDPSARFIIRADRILMAQGAQIVLTGNARNSNVYWRTTQHLELGAGSTSRGTYVSATSATMLADSQLQGTLIALNGAISLTDATIGP